MANETRINNAELEEITYTPKNKSKVIKNDENNDYLPFLEELGTKPKTIDELRAEINGEAPKKEEKKEIKPDPKEKARIIQEQYKQLLKEKEEREISAGFSSVLIVCITGVFSGLFMLLSDQFHIGHCVLILLISAVFFAGIKRIKTLSYPVFIINTIYLIFNLIKGISSNDKPGILSIVFLVIATVLSLSVCIILFTNEKIEKYYSSRAQH